MKKRWLVALMMAVLLLVQAVVVCGGALAEGEEHEHEWSAWKIYATGHERSCTVEGCNEVEKGDHGETCSICGYGMPEHTHTWSEWEGHGTYHERHCTAEGCDEVEKANHDVPCEICGYGVHTHEWSEWEGHGTYHERHCTAEGCDEVETANHDVPCTICGYGVQPEHTFSDEWSYDEVDHWHACTEEGCNWTKDQAEHEWSEWEGHGTYHERHCTVCLKTEQENHELPNGKCDKCGYTMHGAKNEWKYDETKHWHECLFEGCAEKLGEAKHNFVNGVCECGYKQQINNPVKDEEVTPVAPTPLPPQTGDASWLAVGIGMIAAAVCIALRKKQSN